MVRQRSGYSFRIAAGMLEEVASRAIEVELTRDFPALPITDRGNTFAWVKWSKLGKKLGFCPAYGVELAVTESIHAKKPIVDYWTFLARDSIEPINALVVLATTQFRYQPVLTYEQALAATGVTRVIGHRALLNHLPEWNDDPGLMFALGPSSVKGYVKELLNRWIAPIAAGDNRYPRVEDRGLWEIICGRTADKQSYPQWILSVDEWKDSIKHMGIDAEAALANARTALAASTAGLVQAQILVPAKPYTLREMCLTGAAKLGCDLGREEYARRLDRELLLIEEKNFENYFFIVQDICQFARANMLVGPARGSSCGSLVCFLLGITTVDPIPYGLIFERFIDLTRKDLPDIDVDFSDDRRQLVFDYIAQKYGAERVARLGTVALFKPRSILQEAGTTLKIPKWKCDAVAESIIERSMGDARAWNTLEDTLAAMPAGQILVHDHPEIKIIGRMEGHPRHSSQHAAGIVLSDEPLVKYVAVDHRTGAAMVDKKDAEDLNLLKIDALGLTQLSVFEDALELAGLDRLTLEKIPLDDPEAFDVINRGQFSGIFQYNGRHLQETAKMFQADKLGDIIATTALARPGPLASGSANEWIARRNGTKPVSYPHPAFEPYLKNTLGIVIYQETVMEIGRHVGDLSWEEVSSLRKAMSKSLGKEYFDQFGDKWKAGAIKKGIPAELLDKIWNDLCLSGDTVLINPHPSKGHYAKITIKDLYQRGGLGPTDRVGTGLATKKRQKLLMWDGNSIKPYENWGIIYSGKKQTYTLMTESGNIIHATENHRFLTPDQNYVALKDLSPGDFVMSDGGGIPTKRKTKKGTGRGGHNWWHKLKKGEPSYSTNKEYLHKMFEKCQVCREAPYEETHHIDMNHEDHDIENLLPVCRKCHKRLHAVYRGYPKTWEIGRKIFADEIISIEPRMIEDVYDIHMPDPHNNFLAEGIIVHNCSFGSWAFNLSHATAYGIISYQCCWLKAKYPFEFAAATLTHERNPEKALLILREMAEEGFDYVAVDAERSTDKWSVGYKDNRRFLVGPLHNVKGIGPKMVASIIGARNRGEPLSERAAKLLTNPRTDIDSLFPIKDAFRRILPDPSAKNIFSPPTPINKILPGIDKQSILIFCVFSKIAPRDENETVFIAKRGGKRKEGLTAYLNLFMTDDTDTIFGKIDSWNYEELGKRIVDYGRPGKSLWAVKGEVRASTAFRMLKITNVRLIGDIDR